MTFAGLSNEKQRADVIAYLNTLSDNPKPLPTAQGQGGQSGQTGGAAKPAEGGQKPAEGGGQQPAAKPQ